MSQPVPSSPSASVHRLADEKLRRSLCAMVRKRVPPHEVDEIVQSTLADALASSHRPEEDEALVRWVHGIARHKVADFHRRSKRELHASFDGVSGREELPSPELEAASPHDAVDLLRWAERESPNEGSGKTLDWMLREGDGEKLETIAREERLPAPQVRQRVARLRRHYRTRWAAQIAAAALVLGGIVFLLLRVKAPARPTPAPTPTGAPRPEMVEVVKPSALPSLPSLPVGESSVPESVLRAAELRKTALDRCAKGDLDGCTKGLDEAKVLDPAGDGTPEVAAARASAEAQKQIAAKKPPSTPTTNGKPTPSPYKGPYKQHKSKEEKAVGF